MNKLASYLLLLIASLSSYAQAKTQGQLIILQYHHIDDKTPYSTSTRPKDFIKQLKLIEEMGLPVVSLPEALNELYSQGGLKKTSVAITFDDGFSSIYTQAFKPLKERNWPFTIFVNPKLASSKSSLYLNWQQLKELKKQGATIANHGQTHAYLLNKPKELSWDSWLEQEIGQAQIKIEKKLGKTPKLLAYSYGEFNNEIAHWLAQRGYLALGQHSGPASSYSHKQAIARFPAGGSYADVNKLKQKLNTLAAPISASQWQNPVLSQNPPSLTLSFSSKDMNFNSIQCYSGSEGAIPTKKSKKAGTITVETSNKKPITRGRDRYNCTIQSRKEPSKYYWYSQLWINTSVMPR